MKFNRSVTSSTLHPLSSRTSRLAYGIIIIFISICSPLVHAQSWSENFNDNIKNQTNWGTDYIEGSAVLQEINQRLEFTAPTLGANEPFAGRPWLQPVPVNANWEAVLSVFNTSIPTAADITIGLNLKFGATGENVFIELFANKGDSSIERGFLTSLEDDANLYIVGEDYIEIPGITNATIKMSYNASQKLVTTSYDLDGNGTAFGWQVFGTFGLGGTGGSTANSNWNLPATGNFTLLVEGFSASSIVPSGEIWADDFAITVSQPLSILNESIHFNSGQFGFNIVGTAGQSVVIESSSNLVNWLPIHTNIIGSGSLNFQDPKTSSSIRYYRAHTP